MGNVYAANTLGSIAGISDLFTREYFDLCRRRLNPGGIACVWLQAYDTDEAILKSIAHTFHTVFPHMILLETIPMDDYVLIGSEKPFQVDYETLRRRMDRPVVARELRKIDIRTPADLLARIVLNDIGISEYTGPAAHRRSEPNGQHGTPPEKLPGRKTFLPVKRKGRFYPPLPTYF